MRLLTATTLPREQETCARPVNAWSQSDFLMERIFVEEIVNMPRDGFVRSVQEIVGRARMGNNELYALWGKLRVVPLPPTIDIPETKLYSPTMLQSIFGWSEEALDWDGLVCEVSNPHSLVISRVNRPICLKWRSEAPSVAAKRARGITSLYGNAIQQIPPGEMGIIYIAYPECARAEVADARTWHILDTDWHHSALIRVPLVFVSRLYPRPVGDGLPDLTESVLQLVAGWANESMVEEFPGRVFTI